MDDSIVLPLTAVTSLAEKACVAILSERENGKFMSYDDLCNRMEKKTVNIRIKKNLVKAGAFDSLHPRPELLEMVCKDSTTDILAMEREALRFYVSGHPLDDFDYSDGTIHRF